MKIDITLNTKAFETRLKEIERTMPRDIDNALFATAQYGENIILARTKKGMGINGSFKAYTPKYALFRKAKGRGSNVDLNFTGQMLNSMTARKGRGFAEIKFTRATESRKAYWNNRSRPFFGFNMAEKSKLATFFAKRLFK